MTQRQGAKPIFFFIKTQAGRVHLQKFLRGKNILAIDRYKSLLEEVCAIRHPDLRGDPKSLARRQKEFLFAHTHGAALKDCGVWVYFPWKYTMVHFLDVELHEELRTARNKNLITHAEQKQFRNARVAVAGLSVGSHAAVSIALQGGGNEMRLADHDEISGSNLNRIRAGFDVLGTNKAVAVAREIYCMNPFARLALYKKGITERTLLSFLTKPKRVDVLVEEMDDLLVKIEIHRLAKKLRIPVVSAADNGDGIILDVERFDIEPKTKILRGRAEGITRARMARATQAERAKIITNLIDSSVITPRMRASVGEVGKTLYSWPQLGGAAQLAGSAVAYAVRMIATGGPLKSGRTVISFEQLLSSALF